MSKNSQTNNPAGNTPSVTTESIFQAAVSFEYVARLLENDIAHRLGGPEGHAILPTFFPAFSLGAFSSELYLKSLIHIETNKYRRGHPLEEFFKLLTDFSKERVILFDLDSSGRVENPQWTSQSQSTRKQIEAAFHQKLKDVSDAFANFRYYFQTSPTTGHLWFNSSIGQSVRRRILEVRPDLAPIYYAVFPNRKEAAIHRDAKIEIQIDLPGISQNGRDVAKSVAESSFQFESGDVKLIRDITEVDLRKESERIAAIEDRDQQGEQIVQILQTSSAIVSDCQNLAMAHLAVATALDVAKMQMNAAQDFVVQQLSQEREIRKSD